MEDTRNKREGKSLRDGKVSEAVLDRSIEKRLGKSLEKTGKRLPFCKEYKMAMDPVTQKTSQCGFLSVIAAVNDLAADGFAATTLQTTVLLPPASEESLLRTIEDQIAQAAVQSGAIVTGGHTEVTTAVTRPVVITAAQGLPFAETSDLQIEEAKRVGKNNLHSSKPGDAIVATNWIGLEGTMMLAVEKEEALRERFPIAMIETAKEMKTLLSVNKAAKIGCQNGCTMVHASEGGIMAALWKLSKVTGLGLHVQIPEIPIRQETIEFTDYLRINPYEMESAGCLLMTTENAKDLIMRLNEAGIHAAQIGTLQKGRDKILQNGDEIGNLNLPAPDALIGVLA